MAQLRRIARWRIWVFAGTCALGLALQLWRVSDELGYELSYVALVGVSLLSSLAVWVAIGNGLVALPWVLWPWGRWMKGRHFFVQLNRWVGHGEALLGWLTLSMVFVPWLVVQLPVSAAVVLFGGPLIDRVALRHGREVGDAADLNWARRPWIYVATVVSLALLALLAWPQVATLFPLMTAILLGLLLRCVAALRRDHAIVRAKQPELDVRRAFRERVATTGQRYDTLAAAIVLGLAFALPVAFLAVRNSVEKAAHDDHHARRAGCEPALARRDVSLFLVADSQFHELDGRASAVHLDLVDALVPVAVRPIELDLLSESTLRHFAALYGQLRAGRPNMPWAHVGDFGDLGCAGELDRLPDVFAAFGRAGRLAGIVPGNHDSTFVGNFDWHPDWDRACSGRRVDKAASNRLLAAAAHPWLVGGAVERPVDHPRGFLEPARSWLATVSPLGETGGRGVVGVFVDTSDRGPWQLGVAGVFGSISPEQVDWLTEQARRVYPAPPLYVVFMHHPFAELDPFARRNLTKLLRALGDDTLALVSAHTHLSARRYHDGVLHRSLPEYVLGSTIDPPQEAAVLDVGRSSDGAIAIAVETIPAIARPEPDMTCGAIPTQPTLAECDGAIGRLLAECPEFPDEMSSPEAGKVGPIEALKYWLSKKNHPVLPDQVREERSRRAGKLLGCLAKRDPSLTFKDPMNDAEVFPLLRDRFERRRLDLVCLSWAGSILQQYKQTESGPTSFTAALKSLDLHSKRDVLGAKRWVDRLLPAP